LWGLGLRAARYRGDLARAYQRGHSGPHGPPPEQSLARRMGVAMRRLRIRLKEGARTPDKVVAVLREIGFQPPQEWRVYLEGEPEYMIPRPTQDGTVVGRRLFAVLSGHGAFERDEAPTGQPDAAASSVKATKRKG